MEFQPGAISLSAISGGTLASGVIPWARFTRWFVEAENPGLVTLTAAIVGINYIDTAETVAGDYIIVWARIAGTKGVTAGRCHHYIKRDLGPGVIDWMLIGPTIEAVIPTVQANGQWKEVHGAIGRITTGGTMRLRQQGSSIGSNMTVNIQQACLSAWVIRGS